ncbi:carboxymuconolactone decarboxylase family protein (plasmid) [Paraburkholderia sp. PREW-6R]|uniref:carboxymuconolactone decarboxylase family protein n=1 Tax=Paraburkholderia sp. PREW-6R TaxID=3141544 RepID=UPI0031F555F0
MSDQNEFFKQGLALRRDMFGPAGADQAIESATELTAPLQELVTRFCFGEVWHRPHLDHKTRSMLTLAIVATLSRPAQMKIHVRGAIANGVSKEEIREVLMHTLVYAGVPAAVDSFTQAAEVLKDMGLD